MHKPHRSLPDRLYITSESGIVLGALKEPWYDSVCMRAGRQQYGPGTCLYDLSLFSYHRYRHLRRPHETPKTLTKDTGDRYCEPPHLVKHEFPGRARAFLGSEGYSTSSKSSCNAQDTQHRDLWGRATCPPPSEFTYGAKPFFSVSTPQADRVRARFATNLQGRLTCVVVYYSLLYLSWIIPDRIHVQRKGCQRKIDLFCPLRKGTWAPAPPAGPEGLCIAALAVANDIM
jgi:hypothetical protein